MERHRIEATLEQDGTITLDDLPFHAGETVEITIIGIAEPADAPSRRSLRGTPVTLVDPFSPVSEEDWESAQ